MRIWIILLSLTFFSGYVDAQNILTLEEYLAYIKNNHPVSKQADITVSSGDMYVRKARGGFDPKTYSNNTTKDFEDKRYFDLNNTGVKIPTWLGIEVKAGYLYNEGYYLNPENNVTGDGVTYAGVSVPIGNGLFMDERRADLRKAQAVQQQSQQERVVILNNLYVDAITDYLDWAYYYSSAQVYKQAVVRAEERLEGVKQGYFVGEYAAIDTVEASILLQNRQIRLNEIEIELVKSRNLVSTHIWTPDGDLVIVKDSVNPEAIDSISFIELPDSVLNGTFPEDHPELQIYKYKLAKLDIDKRLSTEMLKPTLNLKYQALTRDFGVTGFLLDENYKYGFEFEFPLFLRKARGAYNLAKLKIQDTEYDRNLKRASLLMKFDASKRQLKLYQEQRNLNELNFRSYTQLFDVETYKFNIGESTLFYVNTRETKKLEANEKYYKAINKSYGAIMKFLMSRGDLYNFF